MVLLFSIILCYCQTFFLMNYLKQSACCWISLSVCRHCAKFSGSHKHWPTREGDDLNILFFFPAWGGLAVWGGNMRKLLVCLYVCRIKCNPVQVNFRSSSDVSPIIALLFVDTAKNELPKITQNMQASKQTNQKPSLRSEYHGLNTNSSHMVSWYSPGELISTLPFHIYLEEKSMKKNSRDIKV